MQLTYVLELLEPTNRKASIIEQNIQSAQRNRMEIADKLKDGISQLSTKDFGEKLPSAVINQNIREVKALYRLFKKSRSTKDNLSFKDNQPIAYNNQNYRMEDHFVSVPLYTDRSKRYWFPVVQNSILLDLKDQIRSGAKLGKASLFRKSNKYYFAVTVKVEPNDATGERKMGIDVGLNQIAVASIQDSSGDEINRWFISGKEAGFVRRKYRALRRSLGQAKQPKKIMALGQKEAAYMRDLNHKISRYLVNLAVQEEVSTLAMENLKGIRRRVHSSKKADINIHAWSFHELQSFIEYKAELAGIHVEYVDPSYTSQTCNACGKIDKANRKRNRYICSCGYSTHADLNAARNICDKLTVDFEKLQTA